MQQLLKGRPRPDGVFCFNDPVAVGAVRAILESGLSIPEDIAIVGAATALCGSVMSWTRADKLLAWMTLPTIPSAVMTDASGVIPCVRPLSIVTV